MPKDSTTKFAEPNSAISLASGVRLIGVIVLLAGALVAYQVVEAAWELFDDQSRVINLSTQIEEATSINRIANEFVDIAKLIKFIRPQSQKIEVVEEQNEEAQVSLKEESLPQAETKPELKLNLTYFIAWILIFLLLGLIARVAYWFINAGGKIALYGSDQGHQITAALKQVLLEQQKAQGS